MIGRRRLALAVVLGAGLAVGALGAMGWPASAYRDGDFTQFWLQPTALLQGGDPYDPAWWAAAHERSGQRPESPQAVYPPQDAIAFLPLALLPLPYAAAAWIVAQLLAVTVAAVLLARRILPRARRGVFLAVAASFQPVWLLAVGANVTGFLFAAVVGAFLAAADHRPFRCGACCGLLVVKPHPFALLAVAILFTASWPDRRRVALGALAIAGPLVAATVVLRPSWYAEWLGSAVALGASPRSNATAWTLGRITALPSWSGAALAALVIAAFALWLLRVRPALPITIAGALPVSLAVAPYGWSYDQLQLLVPIAVVVAAAARPAGLALTALVVTVLPWSLYVLAFRRGGEELSVLTPLLVFALFVAFPRSRPIAMAPPAPRP